MSGHVPIVTGGASGIGAEIARQLRNAGYEIVVLDRQKPKDAAAKLHGVEVDLLDNNAVAQAAADVAQRFAVTHIVHNAGTIRPASIEQTMEPRALSAAEARALGVPIGSLGMRIVRRYFDAKGRIFEHAVSVQGGDESRLTMMIRANRPG